MWYYHMIRSEIPYEVQKIQPKMKLNSKHYSKLYTALTFISGQCSNWSALMITSIVVVAGFMSVFFFQSCFFKKFFEGHESFLWGH